MSWFERNVVTNFFAIALLAVAILLILIAGLLQQSIQTDLLRRLGVLLPFGLCIWLLLLFSLRFHRRRHVRRLVYALLKSKIESSGYQDRYFENFLGDTCLRYQARYLLRRIGKGDRYHHLVRSFGTRASVVFTHPDPLLMDHLNFDSDIARTR